MVLEYFKIRAALNQYGADVDRVIAAQRPDDPNHQYFRATGIEEQRAQLVKDWAMVLTLAQEAKSRSEHERRVLDCVSAFVKSRLALLNALKDQGEHGHYMWEAPLWAYWSCYLLYRKTPSNPKVTGAIAATMGRWVSFLGLNSEQKKFFDQAISTYDALPG